MPPAPTPSRTLPGRSRQQVATALGCSVTEVARIETIALLKARREAAKRGLTFADLLALIYPKI